MNETTVRLNANEKPFDLTPAAKAELLAAAQELPFNRYEPGLLGRLLQEIASYVARTGRAPAVTADFVVPGNGSDELILMANLFLAGPGANIVTVAPTFEMYGLTAAKLGASVTSVRAREEDGFVPDPDAVIAAAKSTGARLVYVCRPNNPTGVVPDMALIEGLLEKTPAYVVVDEAYFEYVGSGPDATAVPLVADRPRLVVFRTFSKAFGLAGLRLGYAIAHPEVAARLNADRLPLNTSTFTQLAALTALRHADDIAPHVAEIVAERERVRAELAAIPGVTVYPSVTNFLLFKVPPPADAESVWQTLRDRWGILVRHYPQEPDLRRQHLRVSVAAKADNDAFLAALRGALAGGRLGCF